MSEIIRNALGYARNGFPVMPLWWPEQLASGEIVCACWKGKACDKSPGKHPLTHWRGVAMAPRGKDDATDDTGVIKTWWRLCPQANLGVAIPEGIVVLDFDPKHGGELSDFETEHGELPPSWRVQTGSGGWHCYFKLPDGVTITAERFNPQTEGNGQSFPGVDILVCGCYVVAPPSSHVSGRAYAFDVDHHPADVALAEIPAAILDRLKSRKPEPARPSRDWTFQIVSEYRDAAAARVAGKLLAHGLEFDMARTLLVAWNRTYCQPPLSHHELKQIFERVVRAELRKLEKAR